MSDLQTVQDYNRVTICTASLEAIGCELSAWAVTGIGASAVWPSANLAIYIPFVVYQPWLLAKISVLNGTVASGNIDAGVYDGQGDRLVSIGSTAQSGTSASQTFDVTDTLLYPGVYYMATAMDNVTGTLAGFAPNLVVLGGAGVLQQAAAFPLPATATFAAMAQSLVPFVSLSNRTLF